MNNTRRTQLLAAIMVSTLMMIACSLITLPSFGETVRGSGNVIEETREISNVTGVELATLGNLVIEVSDTESLRIEAEDNLMEYFESEVRGGKLRIRTKEGVRLNATRPVNYYLTVFSLDTIVITSSGDIQAPDLEAEQFSITISSSGDLQMGNLNANKLDVTISSSGDLQMGNLNANNLDVTISSSGDLDIAGGQVQRQDVSISSSGSYTAPDLESAMADVRLSSSGSATIWVQDNLRVNLSSSGDVRYRGNPTVDATMTSSGEVIQVND